MALDAADLEAIGKVIANALKPKDEPVKFEPPATPSPAIKPDPESGYVSSEFVAMASVFVLAVLKPLLSAMKVSPEVVEAMTPVIQNGVMLVAVYIAGRTGLKIMQVNAAAKVATSK